MHKTMTVNGKRFTGKAIDKRMNPDNMTCWGEYIILLNGKKFYAHYRREEGVYMPVSKREDAEMIFLTHAVEYGMTKAIEFHL